MFTYIIGLCEEMSVLGPVEPFLYKLAREKKMLRICTAGSMLDKIDAATKEVKTHLGVNNFRSWQVIFVNKLTAHGAFITEGTIGTKLYLIKKRFLPAFKDTIQPTNIFVVTLDEMLDHSELSNFPTSEYYRSCLEMDAKGYTSLAFGYALKDELLQAMEATWKKYPIDNQDQLVESYDQLEPSFQLQVDKAFDSLIRQFDNMVQVVQKGSDTFFEQNRSVVDDALIERVAHEFRRLIWELKKDPRRYRRFSPARVLRQLLQDKFSILSTENLETFRLFRFPFYQEQEQLMQENLIKLLLFLHYLIEDFDHHRSDFQERRPKTVRMVFNPDHLNQVLLSYIDNMQELEKNLQSHSIETQHVKLNLVQDRELSFQEQLEERTWGTLNYTLYRQENDMSRWFKWNEANREKLHDLDKEAFDKIRSAIDRERLREYAYAQEEVTFKALQEQKEAMEREAKELHEQLDQYFSAGGDIHIPPVVPALTDEMEFNLARRPSSKVVLYCLVVTGVLYLFSNPALFTSTHAPWVFFVALAVMTGLYFGIFGYIKEQLLKPVRITQGKEVKAVNQIKNRIRKDFENQLNYEAGQSRLHILQQKVAEMDQKEKEVNRQVRMIEYHQNLIRDFLPNVANLRNALIDEQDLKQPVNKENFSHPRSKFDHTRPAFTNEQYCPLDYVPYADAQEPFEIDMHGATRPVKGSYTYFLSKLQIKPDTAFPTN